MQSSCTTVSFHLILLFNESSVYQINFNLCFNFHFFFRFTCAHFQCFPVVLLLFIETYQFDIMPIFKLFVCEPTRLAQTLEPVPLFTTKFRKQLFDGVPSSYKTDAIAYMQYLNLKKSWLRH